jgi:DNA-binding NarL/FixJ family response regulator
VRLLICDDHKVLVEGLSLVLSKKGHTIVVTALDPDEAVEAARQHQPDACLLDGYLAVDPLILRDALRPAAPNDDPLWMLKFLTEREWEVLRCIMEGLSTQQMAEKFGVHRCTARTHVQNTLTKLGVHSRLQAAALMTANATEETWPVHLRERHALSYT